MGVFCWERASLELVDLEPTVNDEVRTGTYRQLSTLSSLSTAKKMLPTTLPVVIIPLGKRSLICVWTASETLLTTALVSKGSWSSMLSVEELVLGLVPFSWSVCLLIMAKSQSLGSLSDVLISTPLDLLSLVLFCNSLV